MAAILKLVPSTTVHRHGSRRPIQNFYFGTSPKQHVNYGRAVTVEGAIRAAVTKLLGGHFNRVDVRDEYDNILYRIHLNGQSISIRKM